ncbi:hypothetical protein BU24DRAFT_453210 [Aaosphaeria arxii CBS 175.79]|uniref:Uncharacterized protein n=1 Tax=Aaosphaeria arxii CBS 175.79 TaxID=1450172 RepID=A0A6A5XI00_9PLEO|nr:uncharacterized protein BU24DRAFT_453210 [Aaosphaeria arxii CBS 175.79]KAF2012895.1 hypothetical protein BU24DRAFT_453210 [Aaosphaeria arxii CBS 175.79]
MDFVSGIIGIQSLLNSQLVQYSIEHLYSGRHHLDDWRPIKGKYLEVFDLNAGSDYRPNVLVKTGEDTSTGLQDLHDLPPQEKDTVRVYILHDVEHDKDFEAHVQKITSTPLSGFLHHHPHSTIPSLSRRLEGNEMPWWQDGICVFGTGNESQGLFQTLVRCHIRLRCIWRENRMLCFIFCEAEAASYIKESRSNSESAGSLVKRELARLSANIRSLEVSLPANLKVGVTRLKQQRIMILRVCHAVLIGHSYFLSATETLFRISMRNLNDPDQTIVASALLQVLSQDSYFWEQVQQNVALFLDAVGFFQKSLQLMDDLHSVTQFQEFFLELQALCTALENQTSSLSSRLNSRIQFFEIGRSLHESGRGQLLTLLAVIFLPLSLASSILSMQTRFTDLHYLIYDFFGVIFLLGTLTFILLGVLLLLRWGYGEFRGWLEDSKKSNFLPTKLTWLWTKRTPIFTVLLLCIPWSLIVASFLVGMLNDIGIGLKVLGYGITGFITLFGVLVVLMRVKRG